MRELLFRGKASETDWVYGDLIKEEEQQSMIRENINTAKHSFFRNFIVHPHSVGQFTGITDKNGVRIFEGDIIKFDWRDDRQYLGYVVWDNEYACFDIKAVNERLCPYFGIMDNDEFEVIGNIFDNPELLESEVTE